MHLHVEYALGCIINPFVNNSRAHVINASVVVILDPLAHLNELQLRVSTGLMKLAAATLGTWSPLMVATCSNEPFWLQWMSSIPG
jgi:hypothetical protein